MRWYVVHAYSGFEKSVARNLIERTQRLAPTNPRLAAITEFRHELMKRYGIRPERTPIPRTRRA